MDSSTGGDKSALGKVAKDLIKNIVVVIPVAIGNKPVPDLKKEFPDEEVINANDTDHPIKIADKIQDKLVSGKYILWSLFTHVDQPLAMFLTEIGDSVGINIEFNVTAIFLLRDANMTVVKSYECCLLHHRFDFFLKS